MKRNTLSDSQAFPSSRLNEIEVGTQKRSYRTTDSRPPGKTVRVEKNRHSSCRYVSLPVLWVKRRERTQLCANHRRKDETQRDKRTPRNFDVSQSVPKFSEFSLSISVFSVTLYEQLKVRAAVYTVHIYTHWVTNGIFWPN